MKPIIDIPKNAPKKLRKLVMGRVMPNEYDRSAKTLILKLIWDDNVDSQGAWYLMGTARYRYHGRAYHTGYVEKYLEYEGEFNAEGFFFPFNITDNMYDELNELKKLDHWIDSVLTNPILLNPASESIRLRVPLKYKMKHLRKFIPVEYTMEPLDTLGQNYRR